MSYPIFQVNEIEQQRASRTLHLHDSVTNGLVKFSR